MLALKLQNLIMSANVSVCLLHVQGFAVTGITLSYGKGEHKATLHAAFSPLDLSVIRSEPHVKTAYI